MNLFEKVKNFMSMSPIGDIEKSSNVVSPELVQKHLSDETQYQSTGFFDAQAGSFSNIAFNTSLQEQLEIQANKINSYRQIAVNTDVANAIDEIINEIIMTFDDKPILSLDVNETNSELQNALKESFNQVCKFTRIKDIFYDVIRRTFIDGQGNFVLSFDKNNIKKGIQTVKLIEPQYLYFDHVENVFKYADFVQNLTSGISFYKTNREIQSKMKFSPEELIHIDFGLFDKNICLSYLEYSIKTANMLQTLEDLLIPLRFSRSVSRRVFNVDVGDIPNKRVQEVMREIQNKFKYKKFYNSQTGEVSNNQHITSMVEDYWFPNRSGNKGTQVDVLDETGNLGELNDILYFAKKLYRTLNVPTSRLDINPDGNKEISFNSDSASEEDIRFYAFVNRLRKVYVQLYKKLLKIQVISTGIMSEKEWIEYDEKIKIKFTNESLFIDKMKSETFNQNVDAYHNLQEDIGKVFSLQYVLKHVLKMNDEDVQNMIKEIEKEKKDKRFKFFYNDLDEE